MSTPVRGRGRAAVRLGRGRLTAPVRSGELLACRIARLATEFRDDGQRKDALA
jgi:hypothetical protein